ncbi:hypothetical protein [Chania multitudinisentens]|uniref:hypothetical protein n=1 Tax=Chania multitudinisentens TaxID=1639108 RepID=UPI0003E12A81|nr:hypothetical protein [Chania multitudinisentens]
MAYGKTVLIAVAIGALLVVSGANAAPAMVVSTTMKSQYESAVEGDATATKQLFESLSKLYQTTPDSALLNMLLGSVETMMARDTWLPWRKLKYAEAGMSRMDKAIALLQPEDEISTFADTPVSLWVKTTAGCTFIEMPEMFNRFDSGYQLLTEMLDSDIVKSLPISVTAATYVCAGKAAKQAGQTQAAKQYLALVMSGVPGSKEAMIAGELLAD